MYLQIDVYSIPAHLNVFNSTRMYTILIIVMCWTAMVNEERL